jgi:hypothetical protein
MDTKHHLEWVTESISPITNFKLQYRLDENTYYNTININDNSAWTEVPIVPPQNNGDHFYSGKFTISNLYPATRYLVRVSSKNDYGYSKYSTPFKFGTKGAGKR